MKLTIAVCGFAAILLAGLSGCGAKGDLFLPEEVAEQQDDEQKKNQKTPQTAPSTEQTETQPR